MTLGNEVNNLWPASSTTPEASASWARELLDTARAAAPDLLCLHSVFDDAWYSPGHPFTPAEAVELGDLTTVHSWVFNGVSRIDGPLGPATVSHADYLVELAAATATEPDRPVWLQEIGVPEPDVPPADAAEFVRQTMELVLTNPALWGVTWWSSHDIDRRWPTSRTASTTSACSPWTTSASLPRRRWPTSIAEVRAAGLSRAAGTLDVSRRPADRARPPGRGRPGQRVPPRGSPRAEGPVRVALPD